MRKIICSILLILLLIIGSSFAFANESMTERIISEDEFKQLSEMTKEYQENLGRYELTMEESQEILNKLGFEDVILYNADDLVEQTMSVNFIDIDAVGHKWTVTTNTSSAFAVKLVLTNLDAVDTHDAYTGTIIGYAETAFQSGMYAKQVSRAINETMIKAHHSVDYSMFMPIMGGKAVYNVTLNIHDDGEVATDLFHKYN